MTDPIPAGPRLQWRRGALAVFGVLLCATLLAQPMISGPLLKRLPDGWAWEANFIGRSAVPDPATGTFGDPLPSIYERSMRIVGPGPVAGSVTVADDYVIRDSLTGKTIWRYTAYPLVDTQTGMRAEPEYRQDHFVFPRNVERRTYFLRQNYLKGVPMRFSGEQSIEGMPVFVFEHVGRGEYTEAYAGSADYPGLKVPAGQEIKCADDRFFIRMWVEPLTGEILNISERCESGDYTYDIATGKRLAPVLLWSGRTEGSDVVNRARRVQAERVRILGANSIPLGLAMFTALFGVVLLLKRERPE